MCSSWQTDLRLAREKVKRKQAILVRQEEEASAKEAALAEADKKLQAALAGKDSLQQQVQLLQNEASELRAKLEESKGQLQSNEQMIRWLNQQVGWVCIWGLGNHDRLPWSKETGFMFRRGLGPATSEVAEPKRVWLLEAKFPAGVGVSVIQLSLIGSWCWAPNVLSRIFKSKQ
jgi:hypothetical protein